MGLDCQQQLGSTRAMRKWPSSSSFLPCFASSLLLSLPPLQKKTHGVLQPEVLGAVASQGLPRSYRRNAVLLAIQDLIAYSSTRFPWAVGVFQVELFSFLWGCFFSCISLVTLQKSSVGNVYIRFPVRSDFFFLSSFHYL